MTEKYQVIEDMIRALESENLAGYGSWSLPCPVDDEISKIINIFLASKLDASKISFSKAKTSFLFLAFSERMAILGVREPSENRLFEGLVAHVIEDFRYDPRENLLVLSLLYYSALKIGLNPVNLFQKVAGFATPKSANYILEYARREPEAQDIHLMGYKEVVTPDGFSYERTW